MNESEVIEHTEALPDRYANRVRPEDLELERDQWPRVASGRSWLTYLSPSLALTQAPVTRDERDELNSLLDAMDMPTIALAGLNVQS